jgi:hypothetical protein
MSIDKDENGTPTISDTDARQAAPVLKPAQPAVSTAKRAVNESNKSEAQKRRKLLKKASEKKNAVAESDDDVPASNAEMEDFIVEDQSDGSDGFGESDDEFVPSEDDESDEDLDSDEYDAEVNEGEEEEGVQSIDADECSGSEKFDTDCKRENTAIRRGCLPDGIDTANIVVGTRSRRPTGKRLIDEMYEDATVQKMMLEGVGENELHQALVDSDFEDDESDDSDDEEDEDISSNEEELNADEFEPASEDNKVHKCGSPKKKAAIRTPKVAAKQSEAVRD